jgi:mannosyltransferase OCH1-like enzyme
MVKNYKMITLILFIVYIIININYKYNYVLPNNDKFNINKNYYDIKELIHLYSFNNNLKNINLEIPKFIKPRNDILLLNNYEIIKNGINFDDYFFVIYYLDINKCKIIVRRLDSYELNYNFSIKIYNIDNLNFEIINFHNYHKLANEIIIEYETKIKLEKVIYEKTKIPKVIIQTGNSKLINLAQYNTALSFIELNPEYTFVYFDENDRINFLIKHFDVYILNAYNNLIPGAYKADLFRYCYMYINGGCYFDNKMINRIPLREIINKDTEMIFCYENKISYINGLLISTKKNNIFKKCIDECVYNISNKLYSKSPWDVTGPRLLFRYIDSNYNPLIKTEFNNFNLRSRHKNCVRIVSNNKIFCNITYFQYYDKYLDPNYYVILWLKKNIYY